jgi:hypothetical protein
VFDFHITVAVVHSLCLAVGPEQVDGGSSGCHALMITMFVLVFVYSGVKAYSGMVLGAAGPGHRRRTAPYCNTESA